MHIPPLVAFGLAAHSDAELFAASAAHARSLRPELDLTHPYAGFRFGFVPGPRQSYLIGKSARPLWPPIYVNKMNALANSNETTPTVGVKLLVDQHGLWAVLRAFVVLVVRREREVVQLDYLSPYIRRDMGLPPIDSPRQYWELR